METIQKTETKKRVFNIHSIRFKMAAVVTINCLLLVIFSLWLLTDSMNMVERDMMDDRLESDVSYLRETLGESLENKWNVKDGGLYVGETLVGNGSMVKANVQPFSHCSLVTGSDCYAFIRTDNDDQLIWVTDGGYQQGHYRRVAGTTRGPYGERLEGTYMDKKVADTLEKSKDGVYTSEANVNGRMIYCRYELLYDESGEIIGVISAGRSMEEMVELIRSQKTRGFILILTVMVLMSVVLATIVNVILDAIGKIKTRLGEIGTGVFPEEPLKLNTNDEMEEIADSVNEMVDSLKEKERIGAELSLATDIQAHMLPSIFPPFPDHNEFDIYATMDPAKEVGGDFYDFFMLGDQQVAVIVADVSGKGVPAALFMVIAKTLIKYHAQSGLSPAEVFTKVNQMLCEGNEAGLFVTAWMGILNLESGKLTYVNAGHNPPLLKTGDGGFTFLRSRPGFVLAGMEGLRYKQNELDMQPGDRLFLYTDGVTEATNLDQKLFGEERLSAYLNSHPNDPLTDSLTGLRAALDEFVGEAEQFDDITMLMMEYRKRKEVPAEESNIQTASAQA